MQILEKVCSSDKPALSTSLCRIRELLWIKELGTAKPYGYNDQLKGFRTLSSTSRKKANIYATKKTHPQPESSISTLADLMDMTDQPEGVHKINTILFSVSFPQLCVLQELALQSDNYDFSSAEYRVVAIILDIANYRSFKPVRSDVPVDPPKNFMKIKFMNKAIDVVNLPAIVRSKSGAERIPVYFRNKEPPVISYD